MGHPLIFLKNYSLEMMMKELKYNLRTIKRFLPNTMMLNMSNHLENLKYQCH